MRTGKRGAGGASGRARTGFVYAAYGTTDPTSAREDIERPARELHERLCRELGLDPAEMPFRVAYASAAVRARLEDRGGSVLIPADALSELASAGVGHIWVSAPYLAEGTSYRGLCASLEGIASRFEELRCSSPLLATGDGARALARILDDAHPRREGRAIVLACHGFHGPERRHIEGLAERLALRGRDDMVLGALAGEPGLPSVVERLGVLDPAPERVELVPVLLTAGVHVMENLAGGLGESWRSRLSAAGWDVEVSTEGLIRLPAIRDLLWDRLVAAERVRADGGPAIG